VRVKAPRVAQTTVSQQTVALQAAWQSVFAIPLNWSQASMHNVQGKPEALTAPRYACWGARCFTCCCRALSLRSTGGWMLGSIKSSDSLAPGWGV
jgi:hypothetical protein